MRTWSLWKVPRSSHTLPTQWLRHTPDCLAAEARSPRLLSWPEAPVPSQGPHQSHPSSLLATACPLGGSIWASPFKGATCLAAPYHAGVAAQLLGSCEGSPGPDSAAGTTFPSVTWRAPAREAARPHHHLCLALQVIFQLRAKQCAVCREPARGGVLQPCQHRVLCEPCATGAPPCPYCEGQPLPW